MSHKKFKFDSSYQRIQVYKYTSDDWYPSFILENPYSDGETLVRVTTMALIEGDYRVCVWGADDIGMECDVPLPAQAIQLFNNVIRLKDVTREILTAIGFIQA